MVRIYNSRARAARGPRVRFMELRTLRGLGRGGVGGGKRVEKIMVKTLVGLLLGNFCFGL